MSKIKEEESQKRLKLLALVEEVAEIVTPNILQKSDLFFDLAGEDIGARLLVTTAIDGDDYCLRPEFTLPIALKYLNDVPHFEAKAYGYCGPVFRQRENGPAEFDQAGLEFLAIKDSDAAFQTSLEFAIEAAALYGHKTPLLYLGAVDLFEALLKSLELPFVWRPRLRDRFGRKKAMTRLLDRLRAQEEGKKTCTLENVEKNLASPTQKGVIKKEITRLMNEGGLSPYSGRSVDEITRRYMEKCQLAQTPLSKENIDILYAFLDISGRGEEQIAPLFALAQKAGVNLDGELNRLASRLERIKKYAPAINVIFDASFAPHLDYYTGHVFELHSDDGEVKTDMVLASGGQYDRLFKRLGAKKNVAAVGCAVWLDRLEGQKNHG